MHLVEGLHKHLVGEHQQRHKRDQWDKDQEQEHQDRHLVEEHQLRDKKGRWDKDQEQVQEQEFLGQRRLSELVEGQELQQQQQRSQTNRT